MFLDPNQNVSEPGMARTRKIDTPTVRKGVCWVCFYLRVWEKSEGRWTGVTEGGSRLLVEDKANVDGRFLKISQLQGRKDQDSMLLLTKEEEAARSRVVNGSDPARIWWCLIFLDCDKGQTCIMKEMLLILCICSGIKVNFSKNALFQVGCQDNLE